MENVTQKFGSVVALEDVSLRVESGHIHALVGENGAGKTTLMKILYGALQPTEASIKLNDKPFQPTKQRDAIHSGVGMVSQHYSIIPELTCLQNLILGEEPGWKVPYANAKVKAEEIATSMGFQFQWDSLADGIGPAQAQKLEILKLLWRNAKIMILDEPTAMLSPEDSELLYQKLRLLADQGATVIVVTHRLPEVMNYCDEVTVLRSGKLIGHRKVSETNPDELTEMIVGRPVHIQPPGNTTVGEVLLSIKNLIVKGNRGNNAVNNVNFELRAGEVLGLAGVDGNGQKELFLSIWGNLPCESGAISLCGQDFTTSSTTQRIQHGLRLIPEDRHDEAVIEDWTIADNAILGLQRKPELRKSLGINHITENEIAERSTTRFPTKFDHVHQPLRDLSGGNQQKVVNARAFELSPKVILAFQPTRGIDINVSALVYAEFRKFVQEGGAVLVVSFDIDELLTHCDRIIVINHGEIKEPTSELARDRQAIGRLMVGGDD